MVRERREAVRLTYLLMLTGTAVAFASLAGRGAGPRALLLFSAFVLIWLAVARTNRAATHLARLSLVDPLTGLYNRRHLERRLEDEAARALRYGTGFAICVLDLDNFKSVNDRFGHLEGDWWLRQAARVLRDTVRRSDLAFRYGGEEFVLLLPHCDASGGQCVVERALAGLRGIGLTASAGVADFPGAGAEGCAVLAAADAACLAAKASGKDRVVRHGASTHLRLTAH